MFFIPPGFLSGRSALDASASAEGTVLIDQSGFLAGLTNGTESGGGAFIQPGTGTNGTSNMVLLVSITFVNDISGLDSSPAILWDSSGTPQSMTLISGATIIGGLSNSDVYFFGLVDPHTGTALKIKPSWTGSVTGATLAGITVVNADQTGGSTTFQNLASNTGTGTLASVSNTAPSTRLTFSSFVVPTNFGTTTANDVGKDNVGLVSAAASAYGTAVSPLTYSCGSGSWLAQSISIKGH